MPRVWNFGANVNTDQIVPGRYAPYMLKNEDELRNYPFVEARPEFAATVRPGDIIVAGPNFGCGSSRSSPERSASKHGMPRLRALR
jgi:methanogen homoaconitase small subunit